MTTKSFSAKAKRNLERNDLFRRVNLGIHAIPRLQGINSYVILDPERIEPVVHETQGQKTIMLRYVVSIPPEHQYDTGERAVIADAGTSGVLDSYLREGIDNVSIRVIRTRKGTRYKIEPVYREPTTVNVPVMDVYNITYARSVMEDERSTGQQETKNDVKEHGWGSCMSPPTTD